VRPRWGHGGTKTLRASPVAKGAVVACCNDSRVPPLTERHRFVVRFRGDTGLRALGPITGESYALTPGDTALIDPRDAVVMVRDRRLQIEAIVLLSDGASRTLPSSLTNPPPEPGERSPNDHGGL
jgi:hypothetical protein